MNRLPLSQLLKSVVFRLVIFLSLNQLTGSLMKRKLLGIVDLGLDTRLFFDELTGYHKLLLNLQHRIYSHFGIDPIGEPTKYADLDLVKYHMYLMRTRKIHQMYPNPYPDPYHLKKEVPSLVFLVKLLIFKKFRQGLKATYDFLNRGYFEEIMRYGEEEEDY